MAVRPNIELHIEELVLHGFAGTERWSIADAVRAELTAQLAERGLPNAQEIHVDRLDAGTIARDGRAIGAALHSTIGGEDVRPRR
ncbi:MAG: hypothetical protein M3P06_01290 [Acidobacteriota bacterium]|nr:hypothetical protein [Acidobacteriota bacterium]